MGSGNQTEVVQFGGKSLYPLSHLIGSELPLVAAVLPYRVDVGLFLSSALSVSKMFHTLSDFRTVFKFLRL